MEAECENRVSTLNSEGGRSLRATARISKIGATQKEIDRMLFVLLVLFVDATERSLFLR
jgi:hypothetical protein